jgi:hypothetical protein
MTIHRFFTNSVIIRRLSATSTYGKSFVATGTIQAQIQRIDEASSSPAFAVYGATHKLWCDTAENVKDGDKVIDAKNNEYQVVAVINEGLDIALNDHKMILLRQYNVQVLPRE